MAFPFCYCNQRQTVSNPWYVYSALLKYIVAKHLNTTATQWTIVHKIWLWLIKHGGDLVSRYANQPTFSNRAGLCRTTAKHHLSTLNDLIQFISVINQYHIQPLHVAN